MRALNSTFAGLGDRNTSDSELPHLVCIFLPEDTDTRPRSDDEGVDRGAQLSVDVPAGHHDTRHQMSSLYSPPFRSCFSSPLAILSITPLSFLGTGLGSQGAINTPLTQYLADIVVLSRI